MRERLAAYAHEAWAEYMKYFLGRLVVLDEGMPGLFISGAYVGALRTLIATPYAELPEHQKDYDRAEADKMIAIAGCAEARINAAERKLDEMLYALVGGNVADTPVPTDAIQDWIIKVWDESKPDDRL